MRNWPVSAVQHRQKGRALHAEAAKQSMVYTPTFMHRQQTQAATKQETNPEHPSKEAKVAHCNPHTRAYGHVCKNPSPPTHQTA